MRVLIVEDDPLLGDALAIGLKQRGFEPDWVQDGREAQTVMRVEAVCGFGPDARMSLAGCQGRFLQLVDPLGVSVGESSFTAFSGFSLGCRRRAGRPAITLSEVCIHISDSSRRVIA
jgi:ActR/RegA family two-component response regulator